MCIYLSLTAWSPQLDTLTEPDACGEEEEEEEEEDEEENPDEESVLHHDSWDSGKKPAFRYYTSSDSHNAGPSYLHTPPSKDAVNQTFSENSSENNCILVHE